MNRLRNRDKLPIVLIGGCHNSQFNVSMIPAATNVIVKILFGIDQKMWCYNRPVPECFSWYLVKMPRTGAIATIGNTGLGYGTLGIDCTTEGLDGGICIHFFDEYSKLYQEGEPTILGNIYKDTLIRYANTYDMMNLDHAKSLHQWVLLGDPSLMIGGYSSL
jgi:hypothetical protein